MTKLTTSQPARHPAPTVKATRLAYLIWDRPDLDKAAAFLSDFGLIEMLRTPETAYFRGTAAAPFCYEVRLAEKAAFVGFALEVASRDDLLALSALPGASAEREPPATGSGLGISPSHFIQALPIANSPVNDASDHTPNQTTKVS